MSPRCPGCGWMLRFRVTVFPTLWEAFCWNRPEVCSRDVVKPEEAVWPS